MITQEYLKNNFKYCQEKGALIRIKKTSNRVKIGDIAGSNSNGYISISIYGIHRMAHRLIWLYIYGEWPSGQIDHINHNTIDNRIENLRIVTNRENGLNHSLGKRNKSGFTGVFWRKEINKWSARIKTEKSYESLGVFDDWFDAVCARISANNKHGYHENHGR